jgi:hypothetical protein
MSWSANSAGELPHDTFNASAAFSRRRCPARWIEHTLDRECWVEIEIGVLRGQCLDRRIATKRQLVSEIAAWERQRNASRARIKWMFTTEKARAKIGRAYPEPLIAPRSHAKES